MEKMPGGTRGCFDRVHCPIYFLLEACGKALRYPSVLLLESTNILRKLRMEEDPHPRAARYCSSDKPSTRPVTISSMRRIPSAIASFNDAGATTLSTRRLASSKRSSAGSSRAARDKSSETMEEEYSGTKTRQVANARACRYHRVSGEFAVVECAGALTSARERLMLAIRCRLARLLLVYDATVQLHRLRRGRPQARPHGDCGGRC